MIIKRFEETVPGELFIAKGYILERRNSKLGRCVVKGVLVDGHWTSYPRWYHSQPGTKPGIIRFQHVTLQPSDTVGTFNTLGLP